MAVVLLAVGSIVLGTAAPAEACSCGLLTDAEAFEAADAVFVGTLVDIQTPSGEQFSSADPERFVFEVVGVYKGRVFARQSVVTARDGASCGLEISGPGPFVVFGAVSSGTVRGALDGELYSNLCSGTRPFSDSAIPMGFGSPSPPVDGGSPVGTFSRGNSGVGGRNVVVVVVIAVVVLAAVAGAVRTARRRV